MLCRAASVDQCRLSNRQRLIYPSRRKAAEEIMTKNIKTGTRGLFRGRFLLAGLLSLFLVHPAAAQTKVIIAVGGGACLCYLPTVLAKQLGEYEKAGLAVELV